MTEENLLNGVEAEQEERTIDQIEEDNLDESNQEKSPASKPEGLDDSLWDAENNKIKESDLLEAYKKEQEKALGLRRKLSEKGNIKPPKDVSEYTIDESLKDTLPDESPALAIMKDQALKSGLSKEQFNDFVKGLIPELSEKGLLKFDKELSDDEKAAEFEQFKTTELAKLGKEGPQVLQKIANWGNGMVNKGVLSKDELPVFESMVTSAESMVILNKIMGAYTNEPTIPVKTAVANGLPSRSEIDQIIASPEYEKGDAKLHKQVRDYFEATS
jgi:hypothetical protein